MAWGKIASNSGVSGPNSGPNSGSNTGPSSNGNASTVRSAEAGAGMVGNTECEAMTIAVQLTEEEYSLAKIEIEECSALLWKEAKDSFKAAAARNFKASSRNLMLDSQITVS